MRECTSAQTFEGGIWNIPGPGRALSLPLSQCRTSFFVQHYIGNVGIVMIIMHHIMMIPILHAHYFLSTLSWSAWCQKQKTKGPNKEGKEIWKSTKHSDLLQEREQFFKDTNDTWMIHFETYGSTYMHACTYAYIHTYIHLVSKCIYRSRLVALLFLPVLEKREEALSLFFFLSPRRREKGRRGSWAMHRKLIYRCITGMVETYLFKFKQNWSLYMIAIVSNHFRHWCCSFTFWILSTFR